MGKMKQSTGILYGLIVILVAVILGGYLLYGDQLIGVPDPEVDPIDEIEEIDEDEAPVDEDEEIDEEPSDVDEDVEISEIFPGKIVYTTDVMQDPSKYEADCAKRGGTFNECGTVCAPDADFCVMVCAFTCEDIPVEGMDEPEEPTLETYTDENLGVSLSFPSDMEIQEEDDWFRVYKWGPTQMEDTEFYDGIVVLFMKEDNPENLEVEALAQQVLESELELNGEVINPVTKISYGQLVGYEFTILSFGESSSFFFENNAGDVIRIAHSVEDPENQGFNTKLIQILQSLKTI